MQYLTLHKINATYSLGIKSPVCTGHSLFICKISDIC